MADPLEYEKGAADLLPIFTLRVCHKVLVQIICKEPSLVLYWRTNAHNTDFYVAKVSKPVVIGQEPKYPEDWLDFLTERFDLPPSSFGSLKALADFLGVGLLNLTYPNRLYHWARFPRPTKEARKALLTRVSEAEAAKDLAESERDHWQTLATEYHDRLQACEERT